MQFNLISIGVTHLGNLLPLDHVLPFLHQNLLVVRIRTQESLIVLDDHQFAITAQATSAIHHFASCACQHGLPLDSPNINPFSICGFGVFTDNFSLGWHSPIQYFVSHCVILQWLFN